MSDHKDMTNRHLRHKLQSLSRRLDELEEATNKLQKSEDELLDLQDKIIQAEGSNSSLLGDVEALRKRLLKIQGKDEEVRKAEDLCRTVREKLEEEESLTKELKAEIERLQQRMAELEKLEEAFGKSKSDCSQLCLSLNEEKNLTKKLSSELEALKSRLKEIEGSETKLDRAEQALATELEKLKSFTQAFVSERKRMLEKQREDEKMVMKLKEKLDHQKNRLGVSADPGHADFMRSRIEDELSSSVLLSSKLAGGKRSLDYLKQADINFGLVNKSENEKNSLDGSQEEDNKVKELTQEVERLKSRLKQLEIVEEDLKCSESKNGELHEKFQIERNRARQLSEQVDHLRTQLCGKDGIRGNGFSNVDKHGNGNIPSSGKIVENGKAENEEITVKAGFRQEKPKYKSVVGVTEPNSPKHRNRELSPQHKRETKLRSKDFSYSEESSPKATRRALSPAHKNRRTPKTPTAAVCSDNGLREVPRANDEKPKAAISSSVNTQSGDLKKMSVLSRYPPAANDQKPLRTTHKQTDEGVKKSREKLSKLYVGSDSESNNSDVMPESTSHLNSVSVVGTETTSVSDQEAGDQAEDSATVSVMSTLSKANGSYTAYRSQITPLLANDQSSEGHSSASETESTGSKPDPVTETICTAVSSSTAPSRYARHPLVRDSYSEGSSSRSSFDEELQSKGQLAEVSLQAPPHTPSGIEIQRVCSPREGLRSRAVIKPAIVEIDRKEVMISEPLSANGKPKISTKPILASGSKMTSSITFYPSDPTSSRTSSRSSSVSSEPMPVRERHTSTSNILIGLSSDHHGSVSVPYEISIPKSEITLRSSQDQDFGLDNHADSSLRSKRQNISRMETTSLMCSQHSNLDFQSPDTSSADYNDTESSIESISSSTSMVTSWRSQRQNQHSLEENESDMKNVTVRSTWRNRGALSADDSRARGGIRTRMDGRESEEDVEAALTWKAYPATTFDSEESNIGRGPSASAAAHKANKPSPAEMYMRRINNAVPNSRDAEEAVPRRGKISHSPNAETGGLGRTIPHAPVTSQSWSRSYAQQPPPADHPEPSLNPGNSPALWRRHPHASEQHVKGSAGERPSRTTAAAAVMAAASRGAEVWSPRGPGGRAEGRRGAGSRVWNQHQSEQH